MSHKKYRTEKNCLNCGTDVQGKFCPECGQENIETRENFFHLAIHFIADYFHFDSKFTRSLVPLFTKPGFLTKEYWEGRRVSYIHPLRLYFFVTIIFMLCATYFYNHFQKNMKESIVRSTTMKDTTNVTEEKLLEFHKKQQQDKEDMEHLRAGMDKFFHDLKYISFFLLPLYALIFKVLYIRRKSFYVDHLVYTLHLQSLAYILASVAFLFCFVFPDNIDIIRQLTILTVLVYIALSLRYLYHQAWWKTILKAFIATFLLVMVMGLVLGIYMLISLLGDKSIFEL